LQNKINGSFSTKRHRETQKAQRTLAQLCAPFGTLRHKVSEKLFQQAARKNNNLLQEANLYPAVNTARLLIQPINQRAFFSKTQRGNSFGRNAVGLQVIAHALGTAPRKC
jgi:hypothetical protein